MTNLGAIDHLDFERSHDGEEVIASLNLHGAPTRARLTRHVAVLALGSLITALGFEPPLSTSKPKSPHTP